MLINVKMPSDYGIFLLQAGTNQKYVPGTQIFFNSIQQQLTLYIFVKAYTCTMISYLLLTMYIFVKA